mmetsp:Transcript_37883/g.74006  ORF Transcript_37883/g.74006 Transcript_37883/m.74006 type:complete len:231 (-) Transcript_37883:516-1208(-)
MTRVALKFISRISAISRNDGSNFTATALRTCSILHSGESLKYVVCRITRHTASTLVACCMPSRTTREPILLPISKQWFPGGRQLTGRAAVTPRQVRALSSLASSYTRRRQMPITAVSTSLMVQPGNFDLMFRTMARSAPSVTADLLTTDSVFPDRLSVCTGSCGRCGLRTARIRPSITEHTVTQQGPAAAYEGSVGVHVFCSLVPSACVPKGVSRIALSTETSDVPSPTE